MYDFHNLFKDGMTLNDEVVAQLAYNLLTANPQMTERQAMRAIEKMAQDLVAATAILAAVNQLVAVKVTPTGKRAYTKREPEDAAQIVAMVRALYTSDMLVTTE